MPLILSSQSLQMFQRAGQRSYAALLERAASLAGRKVQVGPGDALRDKRCSLVSEGAAAGRHHRCRCRRRRCCRQPSPPHSRLQTLSRSSWSHVCWVPAALDNASTSMMPAAAARVGACTFSSSSSSSSRSAAAATGPAAASPGPACPLPSSTVAAAGAGDPSASQAAPILDLPAKLALLEQVRQSGVVRCLVRAGQQHWREARTPSMMGAALHCAGAGYAAAPLQSNTSCTPPSLSPC